jgi:hypothetical protein
MDAELLKLCDQVFVAGVAGAKAVIKEALKHQHDGFFDCPVTGRQWAVADANKAERIVCKAKIARAWWDLTKPGWAPALPISENEIEDIRDQEPLQIQIFADYAVSLAYADFDFINHPPFDAWVSNVLSMRPDFRPLLRHLNLRPKPLPGFNPRINCWESPLAAPAVLPARIETGLARR